MDKFTVEIVETVVTKYKVEAKSAGEAMRVAEHMHQDGDACDDIQVTDRFTNVE